MCGIFGFSGNPRVIDKNMAKAIHAKIKILGLYNMDRGKHSCGLFVDNTIYKGVDKEKLFNDFIETQVLPDGTRSGNFTMIGHTRQATHGGHTAENAHPFVIEEELVLAHNGVIRNIWTLCNKYKVSHTNIQNDSLAFAKLIHQEGFKVITEYEGMAALLMTRGSEPNTLYMYRGTSKLTAAGEPIEERPLYYMQTEEGIYVSSIGKSLLAIADKKEDVVKQVEGSIIHKITNGMMTKSKFPIDRGDINVPKVYTYTPPMKGSGNQTTLYPSGNRSGEPKTGLIDTNSRIGTSYPPTSQESAQYRPVWEKHIIPIIWHETLPCRVLKNKSKVSVFYQYGRYWILNAIGDISCAHGEYYINKKGIVVPRRAKGTSNTYFYEGVMMKGKVHYENCCKDTNVRSSLYNFAEQVSSYSEYPVCNTRSDIQSRCKDVAEFYKYRWYKDHTMLKNEGFTPRYSERNYTMKDGMLHSIGTQKSSTEICIDIESLTADKAKYENKTGSYSTPTPPLVPSLTAPVIILPSSTTTLKENGGSSKNYASFHDLKESKDKEIAQRGYAEVVQEIGELSCEGFYRTFNSVLHYNSILKTVEVNAIKYYLADILMAEELSSYAEMPTTIFDDTITIQYELFMQQCIDNKQTVVSMWNDKQYDDIVKYLQLAKRTPGGEIFYRDEEVESVEESFSHEGLDAKTEDVCEFVPKSPEEEQQPTLFEDADVIFEKVNKNQAKIIQMEQNLDKENFVDTIIAGEQATVPNDGVEVIPHEKIREVNDEQEGNDDDPTNETEMKYSFQDAVDSASSLRNCADELVEKDDDFAQDVANALYRAEAPLLHSLRTIAANHNKKDLERYVLTQIKENSKI